MKRYILFLIVVSFGMIALDHWLGISKYYSGLPYLGKCAFYVAFVVASMVVGMGFAMILGRVGKKRHEMMLAQLTDEQRVAVQKDFDGDGTE